MIYSNGTTSGFLRPIISFSPLSLDRKNKSEIKKQNQITTKQKKLILNYKQNLKTSALSVSATAAKRLLSKNYYCYYCYNYYCYYKTLTIDYIINKKIS